MREDEAKTILESRLSIGEVLAIAGQADLRRIKQLQEKCLSAGIPALLGPARAKG